MVVAIPLTAAQPVARTTMQPWLLCTSGNPTCSCRCRAFLIVHIHSQIILYLSNNFQSQVSFDAQAAKVGECKEETWIYGWPFKNSYAWTSERR
jgi:hypothetical protein